MSKKGRRAQINIRLTPEERARLEAVSRGGGFRGAADYLRFLALREARTELTYTVILHAGEADEGGYWAEVPALPGCNSEGRTYEEALANVQLAIDGYLKMLRKLGETIPKERQPKGKVTAAVRVAV